MKSRTALASLASATAAAPDPPDTLLRAVAGPPADACEKAAEA